MAEIVGRITDSAQRPNPDRSWIAAAIFCFSDIAPKHLLDESGKEYVMLIFDQKYIENEYKILFIPSKMQKMKFFNRALQIPKNIL